MPGGLRKTAGLSVVQDPTGIRLSSSRPGRPLAWTAVIDTDRRVTMLRRFGFFVVAALIAAAPAAAQDEKKVQLNIGGGYTGIYGAAADHIGNGGDFTLRVIFHVKPTIGIQGEYGWNGIGKKQLSLPVFPGPGGGTSVPTDFFAAGNMKSGHMNVLFHPNVKSKAKPYVLAGLGVYYRPVNITTPGVGYTTICDPYWYVVYPTRVSCAHVVWPV